MKRRDFLKVVGEAGTAIAAISTSGLVLAHRKKGRSAGDLAASGLSVADTIVVLGSSATSREKKAAQVLVEEAARRCEITWPIKTTVPAGPSTLIALATQSTVGGLPFEVSVPVERLHALKRDGYVLWSGHSGTHAWVAVIGYDERGLLFGTGKLLRLMRFGRESARLGRSSLRFVSNPKYALRGHQMGYRPKTNAYDGWTVEMWDQYIRELAIFGVNAVGLIPPTSDDLPNSPQFTLPPQQMMVEVSRIADSYGLDVWVWYPASTREYNDSRSQSEALEAWAAVLKPLPRLDAVFVPAGDPGNIAPGPLLALAEAQKKNLMRFHPSVQMWVSAQEFSEKDTEAFISIISKAHTKSWLDGIVYGPHTRLGPDKMRAAIPAHYPMRVYPDICHLLDCQFPVPDWSLPYALAEGREAICPRPTEEANIIRRRLKYAEGFITYSEGVNDDVNKFVWSALGWDPDQPIMAVLRDYSNFFIGADAELGFAQTLVNLENNWRGALEDNINVDVTLAAFRSMERAARPQVIDNWRWQQAGYRVYFDAYLRRRLLEEQGRLAHAKSVLAQVYGLGWASVPLGIGDKPSTRPANRRNVAGVIDDVIRFLDRAESGTTAEVFKERVLEFGAMLFQSIRMQLSVNRYQGEAVVRGANLDTLDTPITDIGWLKQNLLRIRSISGASNQVTAIKSLLNRTDPGPGGFYDELGSINNRPHLLLGEGPVQDPTFHASPDIEFSYPDRWGDKAPCAWKHWAGSLYDAPVQMRYRGLDPKREYSVRVVYAGSDPSVKLRLLANQSVEIHSFISRSWPPAPQEFKIPPEATASGQLLLSWTKKPGLGGNGRGCQVAEVWLVATPVRA